MTDRFILFGGAVRATNSARPERKRYIELEEDMLQQYALALENHTKLFKVVLQEFHYLYRPVRAIGDVDNDPYK